jgi:hypothetical protein
MAVPKKNPSPQSEKQTKPQFNPHAFRNSIIVKDEKLVVVSPETKELTPQEIYYQLSADFPAEVVERSEGAKTGKGYDTTGVKYQALVDRLNDVVTPWGWSCEIEPAGNELAEEKTATGRTRWSCVTQVRLGILGHYKRHYGGHKAMDRADAQKGAFTNAFKKTAALFGIGRQAYLGTLPDDDNLPIQKDGRISRTGQPPEEKPQRNGRNGDKLTIADINGICTLGRETRGKKWLDIPSSVLSIIKSQAAGKSKAVADAVLRGRAYQEHVENIRLAHTEQGEKFTKNLDRLVGHVQSVYLMSKAEQDFAVAELQKVMGDGMQV